LIAVPAMKAFSILAFFLVLPFCSFSKANTDDIDTLVARLSATHGLWINGMSPKLDLPKTATTNEVIDKVFQMISFDGVGRVTKYNILSERQVQIPPFPGTYIAISVRSNRGPVIVLIRYGGDGWWSRVFDYKHWPFHGD
jgi:hypothetical protein